MTTLPASLPLWLQLYLAAGIVSLLLSSGLGLWRRLRWRRDPDSLLNLLEAQDPRRRTLWYRVRVQVLAPILVGVLLVLLWPVVPWMKFDDWLRARRAAREEASRVFRVTRAHLLERLSVAEAESRETVLDPLNAVLVVPFGHLNPVWSRLKDQLQPGDELWAFSAQWQDDLGRPEQREGYVLWRGGKPAEHVLTVLQRLEDRPAGPADEDVRLDDDEIQMPAFLPKGVR
jgi:hypothetical protein